MCVKQIYRSGKLFTINNSTKPFHEDAKQMNQDMRNVDFSPECHTTSLTKPWKKLFCRY